MPYILLYGYISTEYILSGCNLLSWQYQPATYLMGIYTYHYILTTPPDRQYITL